VCCKSARLWMTTAPLQLHPDSRCRRPRQLLRFRCMQARPRPYRGLYHQRQAGTERSDVTASISTNVDKHFYRAMLCIRGTSHGPVSVSVSVTSRSYTKTAKRRITQTTPHDSPGTLVFWRERSPRNSTGVTPYEGAECRWGGSKSATFDK